MRASEIGWATPRTKTTLPARLSSVMIAASSVTMPSRSGIPPSPTVRSGHSLSTTRAAASTASSALAPRNSSGSAAALAGIPWAHVEMMVQSVARVEFVLLAISALFCAEFVDVVVIELRVAEGLHPSAASPAALAMSPCCASAWHAARRFIGVESIGVESIGVDSGMGRSVRRACVWTARPRGYASCNGRR